MVFQYFFLVNTGNLVRYEGDRYAREFAMTRKTDGLLLGYYYEDFEKRKNWFVVSCDDGEKGRFRLMEKDGARHEFREEERGLVSTGIHGTELLLKTLGRV